MHSSLVRAQNVFGYFTTVAFSTAIVVAFSVLLMPQHPSASIQLRNVQVWVGSSIFAVGRVAKLRCRVKGRPHYYSPKKEEYAHIKFDLNAGKHMLHVGPLVYELRPSEDLSSLFNWNTKQVFVWITANYPSSSPGAPPSQAIIWDSIINSKSQLHPYTPFDAWKDLPFIGTKTTPAKKSKATNKKTKEPEPEPTPGIIRLKNSKPKYQITDVTGKLASQGNVTLELGWNVQPWVGALTWTMPDGTGFGRWQGVKGGRSEAFDLPAIKGKSATQEKVVEKGTPKPAEATPVV